MAHIIRVKAEGPEWIVAADGKELIECERMRAARCWHYLQRRLIGDGGADLVNEQLRQP